MELSDNYYEVLGVPRHADGEQIKRAYRKLALKWHPDKNLDKRDLAKANFRRLAEAYEVLSDSRKRQIYDQCGKDGLTNGAGDETSGARFGFQEDFFGGDGAGAFNQFSGMTGFSFRDPNDVFKDFFGNSDPFGGLFSDISEGAAGGNERRTSGANMFPGPFVMSSQMGGDFGGMSSLGMQMSSGDCGGMSSLGMQMSSGDCSGMSSLGIQMSSGDCGGAGVKRISTSVNTANGIRIETKKIVENGIETVIVSENGQVKSKTVGGHPTNQ